MSDYYDAAPKWMFEDEQTTEVQQFKVQYHWNGDGWNTDSVWDHRDEAVARAQFINDISSNDEIDAIRVLRMVTRVSADVLVGGMSYSDKVSA